MGHELKNEVHELLRQLALSTTTTIENYSSTDFGDLSKTLNGKYFYDMEKRTYLILAAHYGNSISVRFFIEKYCDIDNQDDRGNTALIWAVRVNDAEKTKLLLEAGADMHIKNQSSRNALDYAKSPEIKLLLLNNMASSQYNLSQEFFALSEKASHIGQCQIADSCMQFSAELGHETAKNIVNRFDYKKPPTFSYHKSDDVLFKNQPLVLNDDEKQTPIQNKKQANSLKINTC